jgi:glucose-6-phosphate 1-dehydrogenase
VTGLSPPVDVFDMVIFGGTGDLAYRKLLPALYQRFADEQIQPGSRILGTARDPIDDAEYRKRVADALGRAGVAKDGDITKKFLEIVNYRPTDATSSAGWDEFGKFLHEGGRRVRVFYLATSAAIYVPICEHLKQLGLNQGEVRVVVEKPIGSDSSTAAAINNAIGLSFDERQTYRIDHYLGKETVQNLLALRFGNALFEPLWSAEHIDHVQITVAETVGVESRASYYANAGALRDMIQNHMLQLLCMVGMEPPASLEADAIRDEKLKVLRALAPIDANNADHLTVRGQYRAGATPAGRVPGYLEESKLKDTGTDTFVALKAEIKNWRWAGVPFYLRTGKRLAERVSEIVIAFRAIPHSIFGGSAGPITPNKLVLRLQPDEGVKLWLMIKYPGPGGLRLRCVPLDMSFAEAFGVRYPDAYERLLMDVVRGNQTLFMRRDEVEAAWKWIDPILAAWRGDDNEPKPYTAGSWGPSAAVALIERDGRTWHEE